MKTDIKSEEDFIVTPDMFKLAVESSFIQVIITNIEGIIFYANEGLRRITGYDPHEVIGHTPRVWGGLMEPSYYQKFWNTIKIQKKPYHGVIRNRKKNGVLYESVLTVSPIIDKNRQLMGFIGNEDELTSSFGRLENLDKIAKVFQI